MFELVWANNSNRRKYGKKRNNYSGKEKVKLIKLHLLEKMPVSDIHDKYNIQPTVYYRCQKQFFEKEDAAFKTNNRWTLKKEELKIRKLEKKLPARMRS